MISSTQLEVFYERYQRERVPNDLSMQAFCSIHNVPYNCFERHIKRRAKFKNIHPVRITDIPDSTQTSLEQSTKEVPEEKTAQKFAGEAATEEKAMILVTIKMSNGFQIHRSNIDYRTLLTHQFVTVRTTATLPATAHTP